MANDQANTAQRDSRSYLLPAEDTTFLLRDEMRAIRFALEYGKAELLLRDWGVRSTVVVFGGARVPSPERAESLLKSAHGREAVAIAKKRAASVVWYDQARLFGKIVSERGGALVSNDGPRDNVIEPVAVPTCAIHWDGPRTCSSPIRG